MSILNQLERDLYRAAQQRLPADGAPATTTNGRNVPALDGPQTPPARRPRGRSRRRLRSRPGVVLTAVGIAIPLAIAAIAIFGLSQGRRSPQVASGGPPRCRSVGRRATGLNQVRPVPTLEQLLGRFAVLRRPQTAADRSWRPAENTCISRLLPGLTRLAATLSNGERLFLTVVRFRRAADDQAAGTYSLSVSIVTPNGASSGGEAYSPDLGYMIFPSTFGPNIYRGQSRVYLWISLAPDPVTTVRWFFPRKEGAFRHVFARSLTIDVPVRGNVAAAVINRSGSWNAATVTWFGADRGVIKTFSQRVS
jgi:hypothetical protein